MFPSGLYLCFFKGKRGGIGYNSIPHHPWGPATLPGFYSVNSTPIQAMSSQFPQENPVGNGIKGFTTLSAVADGTQRPEQRTAARLRTKGLHLCIFLSVCLINASSKQGALEPGSQLPKPRFMGSMWSG